MKKQSRKSIKKQKNERYTFWDFILDLLFWIPELFFWPFRILFRLVKHFWDYF
ncbi:hypothetical protein [Heyndrickxia sporothermodurans]|uniref:Uncharacterized protein n=1 Tax=Heyndrickxia sporothermodurans TaxID=46224 RepID=A0AB37HEQ5_9BACI|nr:hypothetical protein [Heyndrickxia sporothermodurans]MBL5769007.1 hypothetical protein [Heyndrickxia sporothermodurans]MBL5772787.1 hypothetical protein [Heyndrickxia sporothermodurans]MBL5776257.1 hypothetical protein [Heyndrickxia sporothermodurans]MBL5779805.1 hypothetical protein [Heyndrickxia sporothermodurans]MBL5786882.1 hypothetical protein [Heyndrickxia sporothermodurans]